MDPHFIGCPGSGSVLGMRSRIKEHVNWPKFSFKPVLRIRDVYPGSWFLPIPDPGSRIPDPKSAKKRGVKKISCHTVRYRTFFVATNFTKIWIWDPGSVSRKKPILDHGFRIKGSKRQRILDPGSRIRIRNTDLKMVSGHAFVPLFFFTLYLLYVYFFIYMFNFLLLESLTGSLFRIHNILLTFNGQIVQISALLSIYL